MEWEKKGVNYWGNPDCPIEYLRKALVSLVNDVEDVLLPEDYFKEKDREFLKHEISFYEEVLNK